MTIESATYISDLNTSYPAGGDARSEGDNHIRLVKAVLKATFPNVTGAATPTHTQLNVLASLGTGVATALGVNIGSAGAPVLFNGAGGTPSSITLTNATGLPISGIASLGTGVGTALAVNVGTAGAFLVNGGALGSPSSVGTLPAFVLGGAVTSPTNQSINIGTGALTAGAISGTTGTFSGLITGQQGTGGSGVSPKIGQMTGNTTYTGLSFNNDLTTAGILGVFGRVNPGESLYYNVPTGYSHVFTVNGSPIGTVSSTGLSLGSGALTAGAGSFTTGTFSSTINSTAQNILTNSGATTGYVRAYFGNSVGQIMFGVESHVTTGLFSGTTGDSAFIGNAAAKEFHIGSNGVVTLTSNASGTGIVIPGTLSASGTITSTAGNNALLFSAASATTGYQHIQIGNSGATMRIAIEGSTPGSIVSGSTANAALFGNTSNKDTQLFANNTVGLTLAGSGAVTIPGTINTGAATVTTLTANDTTDSSATNNGSVVLAGGLGVAKQITATTVKASSVITSNGMYLISTSTALQDSQLASTATLTNSPVAGNPTKWIAINDNGTPRYLPVW